MNKITFVTSNKNKFLTLKNKLRGVDICLERADIDLVEPQLPTIKQVAESKAKQSLSILKKPVLVNDSGLTIPSLNDFPGPYTKYISEKIGNQGILDLLKDKSDRTAYLEQVFCYADSNQIICFSDKVRGHILTAETNLGNTKKWGEIWNIFAPGASNISRSCMSDEEYFNLRPAIQIGSAWDELISFLIKITDKQNV
ncbi:MAG: hypothetical protein J6Y07_01400 [Alphaproteobacteria bacterium]|nr:hypothetical protein [Alphaproteobacteria bacterium]